MENLCGLTYIPVTYPLEAQRSDEAAIARANHKREVHPFCTFALLIVSIVADSAHRLFLVFLGASKARGGI